MSGATAKGLAHFTSLPLRGRSRRVVGFKLDTLVLDLLKLKRIAFTFTGILLVIAALILYTISNLRRTE